MSYVFLPPLLLMVLSIPANADVFKCKDASGKTIYQSAPCSSNEVTQGVVKVKQMTPEEAETAKAKLQAWQEEQASYEAAKKQAEKEQQAEQERQESLALQRRSVNAQEQQAIAAQQKQNQDNAGLYNPPYGLNRRYWNNQPYSPYAPWQGQQQYYQQPYAHRDHHMMPPPHSEPPPPVIPPPAPVPHSPSKAPGWGSTDGL